MARAGRRYANVPVIVRSTLQDPPVLVTRPPVVVAAAADRRRFATRQATVLGGRQAPAPPASTPGLLMVMGM
jgi:hypothetical protein